MRVNGNDYTLNSMSEMPPVSPYLDKHRSVKNAKVLIFSRDPDLRILLKTLIEIWGIQTVESDSLEKSLSVIETEQPCLILLDSTLPFESHLENIRQFRKHKFSKQIPIIVLSGFSQPEFKNLSMAIGADGFLTKPLDFDLLESYLKTNIERH